MDDRFVGHYVEWQKNRIAAIEAFFGAFFFEGKTLLELGCGYGDIGKHFESIGTTVIFSDGRPEHLAHIKNNNVNAKVLLLDLDKDTIPGKFDIIFHMGVLYHLKEFVRSVENACRACSTLVLESEVCDSDDPSYVIYRDESGYDQAMNGVGVRPSPACVESALSGCGMKFTRFSGSSCNSGHHVYDWTIENTKTWRHGLRAMWFCEAG